MAQSLAPETFLQQAECLPVLDVRTPAEYAAGHLPGAMNLPLFSNDERALIGTAYKQQGRDEAMLLGLEVIGPRIRSLVERTRALAPGPDVLVHCWRGGMRSGSVAWLLAFFGYRVQTLTGGYKAFRRLALASLDLPHPILLLSGRTGSGKSEVLRALQTRGEQVLNLEALANHKGSVFGGLGLGSQPTQEQFENEAALAWRALNPARPVWIEDESRMIGNLAVPYGLWGQMKAAPVVMLDTPFDTRVRRLVREYGQRPPAELDSCIRSVERRLGGLATRDALAALDAGDLGRTCAILLQYYDRAYDHGHAKRGRMPESVVESGAEFAAAKIAEELIRTSARINAPATLVPTP